MEESESNAARWKGRFGQILFVTIAIGCFFIFWFIAKLLGIPAEPRHDGSLLRQPAVSTAISALIAAVILLPACALFGSVLMRKGRNLAGLAAACAGFSAWSMRGGPMHEVLFYAPGTSVFLVLAVELVLLGAVAVALWLILWRRPPLPAASPERTAATPILVQTLLFFVLVMFFAQTDLKKQALGAVFFSALIATNVAETYWPAPDSGKWYWIGPLAIGLIGYVVACFTVSGWADGVRELNGLFVPLARPLPLDYVSAGLCGALLGSWVHPVGPSPAEAFI
jgi:hypothetical protein